MPVPSARTGSLLEWAKAVAGVKLIPVPRALKGIFAACLNFSGAARSRPVPWATTSSRAKCTLPRAGLKSTPVPFGPEVPTAVMVTVSWFAGVPTVILSPTTKPVTLPRARTMMLVAPASAFAGELRLARLGADLGDRDGLDPVADAVDVQPDLVAGRDVGDGGHLDVGRAGGRVHARQACVPGLPTAVTVATSYFSMVLATLGKVAP